MTASRQQIWSASAYAKSPKFAAARGITGTEASIRMIAPLLARVPMDLTVFDRHSAEQLASRTGISAKEIRRASGDPLEYALDHFECSTLLLPARKNGLLVLKIKKNRMVKRDLSPREATGILGLDGDPIYLDEEEPKQSWWKKLFS